MRYGTFMILTAGLMALTPSAQAEPREAYVTLMLQAFAAKVECPGTDVVYQDLVQKAHDMQQPDGTTESARKAIAWLLSPWTDLTMSGVTLGTKDAVDPLIHKAYLDELADAYAPPSVDRRDALISPLFAELRGFPPLLIQVGSAETLLADASRLAEAAGTADVDVTLQIWPHMIHAWPLWNAKLSDGRRALAEAGLFVKAQIR